MTNDLIEQLGLKAGTELWKYIMTHRNIKKQDLLSHHYNIAFNVFRKWFNEVKLSSISVSLSGAEKPLIWTIYSGKVEYESHQQSVINRLREPSEEDETQRAIEHLETGYPNLWKIWTEARDMSNSLLEEVRDFWNDVEGTFLLELEQRDPKIPVLIEYDELEKPQTNFYLLKDTVKNIIDEIYQFISKVISNNFFNIIEENGHFGVGTHGWVFMRTNDRRVAEKFTKLAFDLIHDSEFIKKAEDFNTKKSEIEGSLKTFGETLDYIAKDLEQTNQPLEGKCWLCKRIMRIF